MGCLVLSRASNGISWCGFQYWNLLFPSVIGWWSFSYILAGIFHSWFFELCRQKLITRMYFPSVWGQVTISTVMKFLLLFCGYRGFWLSVPPQMGPCLCLCLAGGANCPAQLLEDLPRRGKAVCVYHALSMSLWVLKQCLREASETDMSYPPHQDVAGQMGWLSAKSGILDGTSLKKYGGRWVL